MCTAYNKTTPTSLYFFLLNFTKGTRWIRETIWCGLAVMADLRCSSCSLYLFNSPVQCSCGDRLCGDCFNSLKSRWVQVTSRKSAVDVVINNMQNWTKWILELQSIHVNYLYVARRWTLIAPSVQKRYNWMNVSRIRQLRMNWRPLPSSAPTKAVPGRVPGSFSW